jgi:hypothetical protein
MKSLKAGAVLLTVWSGLNLVVAVANTAATLAARRAPLLALVFTDAEVRRLDPRAIAAINAQAAFANPSATALCMLVLVIVWTGLVARARWAFWALAGSLVPMQVFGFASDAFLGSRFLVANVVSSVVLVAGLALAAFGLRGGGSEPSRRSLA